METIKWENANALEIGMLMEMAEDGYVFCIEDGKIQAVEVRILPATCLQEVWTDMGNLWIMPLIPTGHCSRT